MEKVTYYVVRNILTRKSQDGKVYHEESEALAALNSLPKNLKDACEVKSYVGEKIQQKDQ